MFVFYLHFTKIEICKELQLASILKEIEEETLEEKKQEHNWCN